MNILICTQVVDKNHSVLGFFHRWIEEFAKHYEQVHVICLCEGEHTLPRNVTVHSLGKESGPSRLKYLWRFYKYSWQLRHEYDVVFVHMNQIYVILGGLLWRALRKRIGLWYMHKSVAGGLWIAEKLTHVIFTASKESFRLHSSKVKITGHGIDTESFSSAPDTKKDIDLITVGRISPAKNLEMAIEVLALMRTQLPVSLTIVGGISGAGDEAYVQKLKLLIKTKELTNAVRFVGPVQHQELPGWLNRSKVFLHTATNGSLDKTLLEAIACGVPVVTSSEAAEALPLGNWLVKTADVMAETALKVLRNDNQARIKKIRDVVATEHSIITLMPKLVGAVK